MQSRARRVHAALEDPPRTAGDVARRAFDGANALACAASLTELDLIMQPAMEAIGFNHFVAVETVGPQTRLMGSYQLKVNSLGSFADNMSATLSYQNIEESRHDRRFGNNNRNDRTEKVNVMGSAPHSFTR